MATSLEYCREQIALHKKVVIYFMSPSWGMTREPVTVTEITDTHVIGKHSDEYMTRRDFKVKHDGKKFTFGGGQSSCTWTYYFRNAHTS